MSDFDRQNTWLSLLPVTGVKYTDGTTQTSAEVEGAAVKSTGESGGSKFLREDGDGTCSWQATESSGAMWSSGWVDEDSEGETIVAGTAFKFTHNLGTTDVVVSVYAADDSSGAYATKVDFNYDSINTTRGAIVFDVSTNSVMIRTMVSYQAYPGEDSGSTDSGTFRSWNSKYIKVIVQAASVDATSITPEGTSVKSTTNSNETSGKVLTADGDGTCSWQAASTGAIKAVRVAMGGSHTHFGATGVDDAGNVDTLETTSVTLSASTTYLIEWAVNLSEEAEGQSLSGQIDFSTDGTSYTKMYDVNQYELKTGGSGHGYYRNYDISLIHGFTTNGSGGTYYFQFDCNDDGADKWHVHDLFIKIFECADYGGGQTYTQS